MGGAGTLGVRVCALLAALGALLAGASVAAVAGLRWIPPPTSAFMLQYDGEAPLRHRWIEWREISLYLPVAVIASEDQKFRQHRGFDVASIRSALSGDEQRLGGGRGASTITQQVAKNLFLWPGRSWLRKGIEAWLTVWIEAFWPKRRILEVYLNVAEFGPGVYGAAAAAETYLGKPARAIDPWEAARLAAVLPDPKHIRVVDPGPYATRRAVEILEQAEMLGGLELLIGL